VIRPRITAQVPFGFIANGKAMPAGECAITIQGDGPKILWIRSGNKNLVAIPHATQSPNTSEKTVLVFHRYGDRCFLATVSLQGASRGYGFPVNKLETGLQAQKITETDVTLLASLH